jgi:hypothetical protein
VTHQDDPAGASYRTIRPPPPVTSVRARQVETVGVGGWVGVDRWVGFAVDPPVQAESSSTSTTDGAITCHRIRTAKSLDMG